MMRQVAWCNMWNIARARDTDVGSRIHLTEAEGTTGKTLCGRTFPRRKGCPACANYCRRCFGIARKTGTTLAALDTLEWVPDVEECC